MNIKYYNVFDKGLKVIQYNHVTDDTFINELIFGGYKITCTNAQQYNINSNITKIKLSDLNDYIINILEKNKSHFHACKFIPQATLSKMSGISKLTKPCVDYIIKAWKEMHMEMYTDYGTVTYKFKQVKGDKCEIEYSFVSSSYSYIDEDGDIDVKNAISHIYSPSQQPLFIHNRFNKYYGNDVSTVITKYLFNQIIGFDNKYKQYSNALLVNNKLSKYYNNRITDMITKYLFKKILGYDYYIFQHRF